MTHYLTKTINIIINMANLKKQKQRCYQLWEPNIPRKYGNMDQVSILYFAKARTIWF